jgi:hypothetical protein
MENFQLHVMDSDRVAVKKVAFDGDNLSTPCNGFQDSYKPAYHKPIAFNSM